MRGLGCVERRGRCSVLQGLWIRTEICVVKNLAMHDIETRANATFTEITDKVVWEIDGETVVFDVGAGQDSLIPFLIRA